MGRATSGGVFWLVCELSMTLGSLSANGWGCVSVLLVVWYAHVKLQQPEARRAFSQGSWPRNVGSSAVVGCTGSQEGVGSNLHVLIGPLVAAAAVAPASGDRDNSRGSCPPLELE